ncbi:MAG: redoxin domain-containing protein [bacterium]
MNKLEIGNQAPDFTLKDTNDREISLKDYRGKYVLLSFHPLAWTPVCEIQMKTLELKKDLFKEMNTVAFGVSVDSVYSKKAWAVSMKMKNTPLLCDFWPHGDMAKSYGQFIPQGGVSRRVNIIVDPEGRVAWLKQYDIPEVPDIEEVIAALRDLQS